jgi:pSer/pThr/pTyr-binding forkhead associated (FHA) protein
MHKLIIEDDDGKAVIFPLIRSEISIGRQASNVICLTEQNVSRRHARLVRAEDGYVLEDLSSYLGTKVNGARITVPTPLDDGDQVIIGDYRLAFAFERTSTAPGLMAVEGPADAAPPDPAGEDKDDGGDVRGHRAAGRSLAVSTGTGEMEPAPATPARLVVMTRPLSGQEFLLDDETLIVGRTSDNDIVLNHKSISRHHAKIIRDGQRYVVIDLQSANGVKVNGAEYRRVELKSGDVMSLGRLRLRFAAGGERVVLEREIVRLADSPGKVLLGVAAIALLAASVIVARASDRRPAAPVSSGAAAVASSIEAAPNFAAGLTGAAPARPAIGTQVAQHLAAADKHRREGNCGQARKEAEAALALDSHNQPARELIAHCGTHYPATRPVSAERLTTAWRAAAPLARERAGRRRATTSPPQPLPGPAAATPPPAPERPRRPAIDPNDPYAKDRL